MFWTYLGPSSGATTIQSNPTRTTDSHLKRIINTNCCIHTAVPPYDGPGYAQNITCSGWWNILRISCASSWVFLYTIAEFSSFILVLHCESCVGVLSWCVWIICETVCSVHCLCCVVSWASPTKWLVISSALDLQFINTHCWCKQQLMCNIKHIVFVTKLFCLYVTCKREREIP